MTSVFAIRTKRVAKYPAHVPCPFQAGAFMREGHNGYSGRCLETVYDMGSVTFYAALEEATSALQIGKNYGASFEVVEFKEVR